MPKWNDHTAGIQQPTDPSFKLDWMFYGGPNGLTARIGLVCDGATHWLQFVICVAHASSRHSHQPHHLSVRHSDGHMHVTAVDRFHTNSSQRSVTSVNVCCVHCVHVTIDWGERVCARVCVYVVVVVCMWLCVGCLLFLIHSLRISFACSSFFFSLPKQSIRRFVAFSFHFVWNI